MTRLTFRFLSFLLLISLLASCARNPVTGKRELAISESREIQLGQSYDPQIVATMGVYEDAKLQAFIDRAGMQMAKASERPNLNWTFRIIDSDVINAFAVPGGYVYFTRGILAHFNNEAEMAGVLGHEIGHVTARHSAQQIQQQQLAQVGLVAGAIASPSVRNNFEAVSQGMQLMFLKFSRDNEEESDLLGVRYSSIMGYDATQMAQFFETIDRTQRKAGVEIPDFLSTHPNPVNRQARVKALAQEWQQKLPGDQNKVNREGYLRLLEGMVYGEDPRQGFVESGRFYHPELKFVFTVPQNFRLANSPQAVQMQTEQGDAALIFTLAQGSTPQQAAQQFASENQLQPTNSGSSRINGLDAFTIEGLAGDGQQQPRIAWQATFIAYGGKIYEFLAISQAEKAATFSRAFSTSIQSFAALSDPRFLNRKPERLRIASVSNSTTLRQFLSQQSIPANRLEEFAILNGLQLDAGLSAGTLVKVLQAPGK